MTPKYRILCVKRGDYETYYVQRRVFGLWFSLGYQSLGGWQDTLIKCDTLEQARKELQAVKKWRTVRKTVYGE